MEHIQNDIIDENYLKPVINKYGLDLLCFLTSRNEYPNKPYDLVDFLNGQKFTGFKNLSPIEINKYSELSLFINNQLKHISYSSLTSQDEQNSYYVIQRIAVCLVYASIDYDKDDSSTEIWENLYQSLIEKDIFSVTPTSFISWIKENTQNDKTNGKIYSCLFSCNATDLVRLVEKENLYPIFKQIKSQKNINKKRP